jgi:hypothetical protein
MTLVDHLIEAVAKEIGGDPEFDSKSRFFPFSPTRP